MKYRRRSRWIAISLLLLVGCWVIYRVLSRLTELPPSREASQWLLPALSLALVVLTLALAGVLIRNLVTLIVQRKRGILGSRLRTKLVFFFLALVLLPALVLFYGSSRVIKQTVEAVIRTPLEHLTGGGEMVDRWTQFFESQSLRRASGLADEIERGGFAAASRRTELVDLLERRRAADQLLVALVADGDRPLAMATSPGAAEAGQAGAELVRTLAGEVSRSGKPLSRIDKLDRGLMARAAIPLETGEGRVVVAVALVLPSQIAEDAATIDAAVRDYRQFRSQRRELVRFYLTLIGLIFIAMLFVATWIGFYLARRITEPIQQVAAASREISAGNLGVRVEAQIGDEMGTLVDAFNEMASELQENREVITRSTADLRRSNRALDDRRRYIETLLANLSTAVVSLDPRGSITTTNPAVEKILGTSLATGRPLRAELEGNGLDSLTALLDEFGDAGGEPVRRDVELAPAAPTPIVSVQVSPLTGRSGDGLGTLIMIEDLSDLLRAQKALAWQEVARRIAHEIKNPLTPIQLAAQRLRKKFHAGAPDLGPVLLEATDSIEHEVGGLKQLVDEFSKFARMPEVRPEQVQFRQVVESVLALYKSLPDIQWHVEIDARVGLVTVDPRQMRRALINLIDNAVAAVEGKGEIFIRCRPAAREGWLHIEVADSGPGIPSSDRDKMFVPYFSTKRRGTGLGLAIVHKVIADHQGTIRVEDNTPRGARFVIEIPA